MSRSKLCLSISFLMLIGSQDVAITQNTPPSREDRAVQTPPSPAALSALQRNWIRPDGGYVIVIRGIYTAGKLDATYFNPNLNPGQLPFARAEAALLNPTVITALFVFALSASGAIFLILELSQPFAGLMQISSGPLRNALPPI
jgi:hypothetical protein